VKLSFIYATWFLISPLEAGQQSSGYCEAYFVSIAKKQVNVRIGPGEEYQIKCIITQKGIPLIVVAKYNDWRKVRDPDGEEGWILRSLLSMKRFIIFIEDTCLYQKSQKNEKEIKAMARRNVIARLLSVRGDWCKVEHESGVVGWARKEHTFGVSENENW
jgi:SH3-like domain-containing protein